MDAFLPMLVAFAEGRVEPDEWLAWWAANADALKAVTLPGHHLRMKPRISGGIICGINASHQGVCEVLAALAVLHNKSERYLDAWKSHFEALLRADESDRKEKGRRLSPIVKALKPCFPKFALFLKRKAADIDEIVEGENVSGMPATYTTFLGAIRVLRMEGLAFGHEHPFAHPTGLLCIADYWLEADGDQVLLDVNGSDDPPVRYYAHEQGGAIKPLAASFTVFIESLPKSELFESD